MADVLKEVDALAGPASLPAVRDITGGDSLCAMLGGLLRLALAVAAVLALLAGAAELGLRAAGAKPGGSAAVANTVPDGWTGFRLRPHVTGQEIDVTNDLGMHAPRSYALAPPAGACEWPCSAPRWSMGSA